MSLILNLMVWVTLLYTWISGDKAGYILWGAFIISVWVEIFNRKKYHPIRVLRKKFRNETELKRLGFQFQKGLWISDEHGIAFLPEEDYMILVNKKRQSELTPTEEIIRDTVVVTLTKKVWEKVRSYDKRQVD